MLRSSAEMLVLAAACPLKNLPWEPTSHGSFHCLAVPDRWLLKIIYCFLTVVAKFCKHSLWSTNERGSRRSLWNQSVHGRIPSICKLFLNSASWTVCLMQRLCLSLSVLELCVEKAVNLVHIENSNYLLPRVGNLFFRFHLTFLLCSISLNIIITEWWFRLLGRIWGSTQVWKYLRECWGWILYILILQYKIGFES